MSDGSSRRCNCRRVLVWTLLLCEVDAATELIRPLFSTLDRLCGLVITVPAYRLRCRGSILGAKGFLRTSGSGIWCTQPREDKLGATSMKSSSSDLEN
jgi:hypothetical protein